MKSSISEPEYWENRWKAGQTGWDIGTVSTPIKEYIDQIEDKSKRILIPGCGNGWEGQYLYECGFTSVFLVDLSETALQKFSERVPNFPKSHLLLQDFFTLELEFDLIIEQTFFCAIDPELRSAYAKKVKDLLSPKGQLVGLLFDTDFGNDYPPFGGNKSEYQIVFEPYFDIQKLETAYNSIKPRSGNELFINMIRK